MPISLFLYAEMIFCCVAKKFNKTFFKMTSVVALILILLSNNFLYAKGLVSKGIIYRGEFSENVTANVMTENVVTDNANTKTLAAAKPIIPKANTTLAILRGVNKIGNYTIDNNGNIRDILNTVVGNINKGDRVNADGSFIFANGSIVYANGNVLDEFGNMHHKDGSITTTTGLTYFKNGDIMDVSKTIYHLDGTVTYSNGEMMDINGITHYGDGSIKLADGTIYKVDGTVEYSNGTLINERGQVVNEMIDDVEGSWEYDPVSNNWKFVKKINGQIEIYKDRWINTSNAKGEKTWYMVDEEGNMVTGWVRDNNKIYYLSQDSEDRGELKKGTYIIAGKTYVFDEETGALTRGTVPASILR